MLRNMGIWIKDSYFVLSLEEARKLRDMLQDMIEISEEGEEEESEGDDGA